MPPELKRLTVYPIKSLDPGERDSTRIAERGRLDREYAIVALPKNNTIPKRHQSAAMART